VRRRILTATLAITAAALIAFGVPLGLVLGRVYRSQQLTSLQNAATLAAAGVPADGLHGADPIEPPPVGAGTHLAYYDPTGTLVAGQGPPSADSLVRQAMAGTPGQGRVGSRLVVAHPISVNETTIGIIEASSPASTVTGRTESSWLAMLALGVAALAAAGSVAALQARRLVRPVDELVGAADRLGQGDFALAVPASHIPELDRAGLALESTAARLGELLHRERAFTANASHQLRTPLTALRLTLENANATRGTEVGQALDDALVEVDRLSETLEQLFVLARTGGQPNRPVPLSDILSGVEQRWRPALAGRGRRLHVSTSGALAARQAPTTLTQILDILVDNAATHGRGTVEITASAVSNGVSIDVADEGDGIGAFSQSVAGTDPAAVDGHGLGLRLANSLTEAAGGRLVLKRRGPGPVVAVIFP
jgi:signal transduction histidine kinase